MNFTRLKLYHFPATRSARVKWLLHELLEDDFDVEVVPLYDGVQYSPDYLQKNPNHNVPALEITLDNGERHMMLESGAMVSLLADLFPEKGLAPAGRYVFAGAGRLPANAAFRHLLDGYDAVADSYSHPSAGQRPR